MKAKIRNINVNDKDYKWYIKTYFGDPWEPYMALIIFNPDKKRYRFWVEPTKPVTPKIVKAVILGI